MKSILKIYTPDNYGQFITDESVIGFILEILKKLAAPRKRKDSTQS